MRIEPELADVLRSLGARKSDILLKVGLPRSLPYFFASLKVAVTLAFVSTVASWIAVTIPSKSRSPTWRSIASFVGCATAIAPGFSPE